MLVEAAVLFEVVVLVEARVFVEVVTLVNLVVFVVVVVLLVEQVSWLWRSCMLIIMYFQLV